MTYKIPIGPYHPALEEPYKIELICEGEVIKDTKLKVGFNFRGIEFLAQKRSYYQVLLWWSGLWDMFERAYPDLLPGNRKISRNNCF